jgi:hypothetical protein
LQELRSWLDAADEQTVTCSGACYIQQVPLGRVYVVEFDFVGHSLDSRTQWELVLVATDHGNCLELQAFG